MTSTTWKRLVTWTTRLALVGVLGLIAFAATVLLVLPRATHSVAMTVLTGSMTPTIPVGSIVIDRPVDPGTLHVGDIATYQKTAGKAEYITHRIVKVDTSKSPTMFTFKGDANRGPDIDQVPATAIRGKVWFHVPYLGAIRDAIHTKGALAALAMLALAGYALVQVVGVIRDRRSAATQAAPGATPVAATPATTPAPLIPAHTILATLRTDHFDGLGARTVAGLLRAALVDESGSAFTLVLAEHPDRLDETIALLHAFDPIALVTTPAPAELVDA